MIYTQCRLQKGNFYEIAWVPGIYARKGKYLRIGDDNGWLVTDVYSSMDYSELNRLSRDHLKTRLHSDI